LVKPGFFSYNASEKSCNGQRAYDFVEETNGNTNESLNIARKVSPPQNKVLAKQISPRLKHRMLARDGTDESTAGMVSRSTRKSIVLNHYSISTHEKQNGFIDARILEKDNPFYSDYISKNFERLGSKSPRARAFERIRSISPRARAANSRALNQVSPTISRRVASQATPAIISRVARVPSRRFACVSSPPLNIRSSRKIDDTSLIQHLLYAGDQYDTSRKSFSKR